MLPETDTEVVKCFNYFLFTEQVATENKESSEM